MKNEVKQEQVKGIFKRAENICINVRLEAESQSDTVSITNVVERLDIEAMLNRAQQGILDLRAYQRPMVADVVGTGGTPEEIDAATMRATMQLLEQPDTPANRVFGTDKETATKALKDLRSLADRYKVTKKEEPQPGDPADDEDKGTTQQGDSE